MLEEILGMASKKETPLLILKDHTELMFMHKKIKDARKELRDKIQELELELKKVHEEEWANIEKYLSEKEILDTSNNPDLAIKNGVLILIEEDGE